MSVLRAILGRFARFLVRVARTLDPKLSGAPYWVMPERMEALRQRYPGAPEHWLELIARRTAIGEAADPPTPPDPRARRDDYERPAAAEPLRSPAPNRTIRKFLRMQDRPAVSFPRPDSRSGRNAAGPHIPAKADSSAPGAPSPATRSTRWPALTFSTKAVRNPIANLLRIERRHGHSAMLHFHAADETVARPILEPPEPDRGRERQTFFPDVEHRQSDVPDTMPDPFRHSNTARAELRWPRRPEPASAHAAWPNPRANTARPDPEFRTHDPRWPELPPLAVEWGPSPSPSLNEAILLAEQIGGTWSE
jgi:hypothetical protein